VLFSGIALVAYRFLLPGPDDAERAPPRRRIGCRGRPSGCPAEPPRRPALVHRLRLRMLAALGVLALLTVVLAGGTTVVLGRVLSNRTSAT